MDRGRINKLGVGRERARREVKWGRGGIKNLHRAGELRFDDRRESKRRKHLEPVSQESHSNSWDIAGFGKVAEAIPPKVYEQTTAVLLSTFQELTAPITETTAGFGRYLRQKFDTMVDVEKAITTYTIEKAIDRAKVRAEHLGRTIGPPMHPKSFVRALEEASKETDPLLHEMWANLLASQLASDTCHPYFISILTNFSPAEAKLLVSLLPKSGVGEHGHGWMSVEADTFTHWIRKSGDELHPWTISCDLLCEFRFADMLGPKPSLGSVTILHRTELGNAFLAAVSHSRSRQVKEL